MRLPFYMAKKQDEFYLKKLLRNRIKSGKLYTKLKKKNVRTRTRQVWNN